MQRRTGEIGLQRLAINEPGDVFEQEADRVADQVMRMTDMEGTRPAPVRLQRRTSGRMGTGEAPPVVHEVLSSPGVPLDGGTKELMESRFGHDFSRVRVHTDGKAVDSAIAVDALAYTVGQDIVFGHGRYSPGGSEGRHLLAHELTHTIQQGAAPPIPGVSSAGPANGRTGATSFQLQFPDKLTASPLIQRFPNDIPPLLPPFPPHPNGFLTWPGMPRDYTT